MNKQNARTTLKEILKNLLKLFLQGLVVLAPIGITIWVVLSLFHLIDGILPNIVHTLLPDLAKKDDTGAIEKIPGLGFIVVVLLVLLVGWVSSSFIVKRLVDILDKVLENTPGIKFIYSSVKDFLEAFAGNKKKFDKPVLVNVDGNDVWRIGFITGVDAAEFNMKEHVVVYVPHSYAISGITYFVPNEKVKILHNISAADAMKFAVTGGVTDVGE
ncbi:MAG: hypothetical protein C0459_10615 [Chitinophaga sp.]|jgi:uncharacterized membrane protein|nr:hypothetical protein [Chitinophaga sp.]